MSRTYRAKPHWFNKEDTRQDFANGEVYARGVRQKNAETANDFVKQSEVRYTGERGSGWGGMKTLGADPHTGKPLGYDDDGTRCPENRRLMNKMRRQGDKAIIAGAIDEMIDDFEAAMQELEHYEDDYRDCYEDYLEEPNDMLDYDDPHMYDDPYDPADDYYDDRWDDYDPIW